MTVMRFVGLYVLSSESARLPWFDNIYADIGDEQSLLQSLSTFSGHLKQISVSLILCYFLVDETIYFQHMSPYLSDGSREFISLMFFLL